MIIGQAEARENSRMFFALKKNEKYFFGFCVLEKEINFLNVDVGMEEIIGYSFYSLEIKIHSRKFFPFRPPMEKQFRHARGSFLLSLTCECVSHVCVCIGEKRKTFFSLMKSSRGKFSFKEIFSVNERARENSHGTAR